jgi:hypothetical protein
MASTKSKAIRVVQTTEETAPIKEAISQLGIVGNLEFWVYQKRAYLNLDILLPVLCVEKNWFLENASQPIQYIMINKKIYVSKYGLTILLGRSKTAVSIKLQDYLYEVIWKLETTGSVSINDVKSRKELVLALSELSVYKSIENHNKLQIKDNTDTINQLRGEYGELEESYNTLCDEYKTLDTKFHDLSSEHASLLEITKKIAKYVRAGKKDIPEADDVDCSDADIDSDGEIDTSVKAAAIQAKKEVKTLGKSRRIKKPVDNTAVTTTSTTQVVSTSLFYLMRTPSPQHSDNGIVYKWTLTDKLPEYTNPLYTTFKALSRDILAGTSPLDPAIYIRLYPMFWVMDLNLTNREFSIISTALSINEFLSEDDVGRMTKYLHQV